MLLFFEKMGYLANDGDFWTKIFWLGHFHAAYGNYMEIFEKIKKNRYDFIYDVFLSEFK